MNITLPSSFNKQVSKNESLYVYYLFDYIFKISRLLYVVTICVIVIGPAKGQNIGHKTDRWNSTQRCVCADERGPGKFYVIAQQKSSGKRGYFRKGKFRL